MAGSSPGVAHFFVLATFDQWMEAHGYKPADAIDLDEIVDEVMAEFEERA